MKSKPVTKVINESNLPVRLKKVRSLIESAGNKIGSVHFRKRSTGELRKMAYRLHVRNPSTAVAPFTGQIGATKMKDKDNLQITVLDVNKIVKKDNEVIGRGAWRTIALENVERVAVGGEVYKIII
jgi:hypothetical protein